MIIRKPSWEQILDREIRAADEKDFVWGENDCCVFACNVVMALTGVDLAADLRDKYSSSLEAASQMLAYCGGGVEALADKVAAKLGIKEIPALMASRGDIVLVKSKGIDGGAAHRIEWLEEESISALAVVENDARYAATFAPEGLIHVPHEYWFKAWRI